jgi:hypothetical protein
MFVCFCAVTPDRYGKRKSMKIKAFERGRVLTLFLMLGVLAMTLAAQQTSSLVVSGMQGHATVIQVQGRNYVDVDGLARLTKGSISFDGTQIVLTLPASGTNVPSQSVGQPVVQETAQAPSSPPGFSKGFVTAGTEAMALVREWHTALRTAIEHGVPINDQWLGTYQAQARESLRLASVTTSTDSDKSAYPFLVHEYNNMKSLSDQYVQTTKDMTYIDPNSLQNNPLNQRFVACAHSLSSMASTNQFIDDGSCQ